MAEFLVEFYVARTDVGAVEYGAERARLAAEELTREGRPIRYRSSIFVPEDETCFCLYEAASADLVHALAHRAGLCFERVTEAVANPVNHGRRKTAGAPPVINEQGGESQR